MRSADDKRDFGLVIVLLRAILRWSRPMLSQASGVDEDLIADCERGISRPIRKNRERFARAFGVEPSFLDELAPVCRSLRLAYERAARGQWPAAEPGTERLEEIVTASVLEAMAPYLLELKALEEPPAPCPEDSSWA